MEHYLSTILDTLQKALPSLASSLFIILITILIRRILRKRYALKTGKRYQQQLIMFSVYLVALLLIIISLPISENLRVQLLSLIGIIISATIALSSTTFIGNAMAGIMLRMWRNFNVGDFLVVDDYFGRVSEIGLLHVEIQTEFRDLMTIPNLYLVTHPTKVLLSSGTIISAQISLGYDHQWQEVEGLLLQAAAEAELEEPYAQVINLGDFSVTYQINGLLTNVKHIISTRSTLRKAMLDRLHDARIEIVSPTFMNTRAFDPNHQFIPHKAVTTEAPVTTAVPEEVVFDIAEEAESLEKLRDRLEGFKQQILDLKEEMERGDIDRERGEKRLQHFSEIQARLQEIIARREEEAEGGNH